MLGRIAEAITKPRKSSAITTLIFQSASAAMTIASTTIVVIAALRAVPGIFRGIPLHNPNEATVDTPQLESHRHGIALARPLLRALVLALAGAACFLAPWKFFGVAGALLLALHFSPLDADQRTALADLVLLSPIAFVLCA